VGVAEVATQAIMSGLPDGSIELDVPFTATTLRQFRRPDDEADTIAPKPTPPNTSDATKSFTKTVKRGGKEKSEKRGWLRGLVQKLHRSGDGKEREQQQEENEGEKENNEKKEKENMMEEQMRVVVSFVLEGIIQIYICIKWKKKTWRFFPFFPGGHIRKIPPRWRLLRKGD
jgi:hypothetical protein